MKHRYHQTKAEKWLRWVLPIYRHSCEGPVLETLIIKLQRKAENVVKACIVNSWMCPVLSELLNYVLSVGETWSFYFGPCQKIPVARTFLWERGVGYLLSTGAYVLNYVNMERVRGLSWKLLYRAQLFESWLTQSKISVNICFIFWTFCWKFLLPVFVFQNWLLLMCMEKDNSHQDIEHTLIFYWY